MWILLCIPQRNFTTTIILFTSFPLPKINPKAIFLSTPFECEQIHFSRWAVNKSFVPYRIAFHASSENMYLWNDALASLRNSRQIAYTINLQFEFLVPFFLHPLKNSHLYDLKIFSLFAMTSSPEAKLQSSGQSFLFDCLFACLLVLLAIENPLRCSNGKKINFIC